MQSWPITDLFLKPMTKQNFWPPILIFSVWCFKFFFAFLLYLLAKLNGAHLKFLSQWWRVGFTKMPFFNAKKKLIHIGVFKGYKMAHICLVGISTSIWTPTKTVLLFLLWFFWCYPNGPNGWVPVLLINAMGYYANWAKLPH